MIPVNFRYSKVPGKKITLGKVVKRWRRMDRLWGRFTP